MSNKLGIPCLLLALLCSLHGIQATFEWTCSCIDANNIGYCDCKNPPSCEETNTCDPNWSGPRDMIVSANAIEEIQISCEPGMVPAFLSFEYQFSNQISWCFEMIGTLQGANPSTLQLRNNCGDAARPGMSGIGCVRQEA